MRHKQLIFTGAVLLAVAWTAWLNVPFSAIVGWVFVSLEKVGENSSNPFEGGSNDVPISSIARCSTSNVKLAFDLMMGPLVLNPKNFCSYGGRVDNVSSGLRELRYWSLN